MLVITEDEVRRHVTIGPIIIAVEAAFKALDRGESAVFPVVRGSGSDPTHSLGIKSGRDGSTGALGVKAGTGNPGNRQRGLPTHTSITLLLDDLTSAPRAVVQANYLNGLRTAAADALAVRELARPDASVLGVVGAGGQALSEIEAVCTVRGIERVIVHARSGERANAFAERLRERTGRTIELASMEDTVRQADVIVTATPATSPLFDASWVKPGTHISAMGADRAGKMELPLELVSSARLFVDHAEQAVLIGESQNAFKAGQLSLDELKSQTLGAVLNGRDGRKTPEEITIFDSSGIAVQDIAAAQAALDIITRVSADTERA